MTAVTRRSANRAGSSAAWKGLRGGLPIVEAKLTPPSPRSDVVVRTRLLRELDAAPAQVISLIAPPGYGKTTLLAQWISRTKRPVAWLTLDRLDNDPQTLISYLAASFHRVKPISQTTASRLAGVGPRILASGVPMIAAELHSWPRAGLLVLDDVHLIADRVGLDALAALLYHLPPGFCVAIAGRSEPGLPFARLRAGRELLEIGPAELALDHTETGELTRTLGYVLDGGAIEGLTDRTEGWAAGIYLATLALRRKEGALGPVTSLSGRDRQIADYLRSEFEQTLDRGDVTFLTRSSVLGRVTADVAEPLTGLPNAAQRLRRLAGTTQFIQELPGQEPTYRYHNLLRDFLEGELETREPGARQVLHRQAAMLFEERGAFDLAIEHSLAGDDLEGAAKRLVRGALPMHQRGQGATLERWLLAFDRSAFEKHPSLAAVAAWVYLLTGRADDADAMADIAERAVSHKSPNDGSASFASQRAMLRAAMAREGPRDALANARIAASLEGPDSGWRPIALMLEGSLHEILGDHDKADECYAAAIKTGNATAHATVMTTYAKRAQLAIAADDWPAASEFVARAEEIRAVWHFNHNVSTLLVNAVNARVAFQANEQQRARESLVRAQLLRPLASHAAPWMSVEGLLALSRAYLAASDHAGARLTLREAEQIVRRRPHLGSLTTQLVETRRLLADASSTLIGSSALTTAELRVLPFLPTYLSFQEIAERLMISRNTVKTHAMSIYGKLWASSRGEAVERAVEIGLLEPYPALIRQSESTESPAQGADGRRSGADALDQ